MRSSALASVVLCWMTSLGWATPVVGQCQYEVTPIPLIPCLGGLTIQPTSINSQNHVAGYSWCFEDIPVAWLGGPQITILPIPPGYLSGRAYDINDVGEICGNVADSNGLTQACVWRNGQPILLGIPVGGNYSEARAINNKGEICGYWGNSATGNPSLRACVWRQDKRNDLTLPGGPNSAALDISESGQVTGWMGQAPHLGHAFLTTGNVGIDVGVVPGGLSGEGRAVSNNGTVAMRGRIEQRGYMFGIIHTGVWNHGAANDIGVIPPTIETVVIDASDFAIVGTSQFLPNVAFGFIHLGGELLSLSTLTLGATVTSAQAINNHGVIAGRVEMPNTGNVAALLMPIGRDIADITGNCQVNVDDLLAVINHWNEADSIADINEDGTVSMGDLLIVIEHWDL